MAWYGCLGPFVLPVCVTAHTAVVVIIITATTTTATTTGSLHYLPPSPPTARVHTDVSSQQAHITTPPAEIIRRGPQTVASYMRSMSGGAAACFRTKLMLVLSRFYCDVTVTENN
jgi:hypothetical protein